MSERVECPRCESIRIETKRHRSQVRGQWATLRCLMCGYVWDPKHEPARTPNQPGAEP